MRTKQNFTPGLTFFKLYVMEKDRALVFTHVPLYASLAANAMCTRGNESNIKRGNGGERRRAGRGRESLVKWNLVTDAKEGGAALLGRVRVARY